MPSRYSELRWVLAGLVLVQLIWAGNNIIARAVVGEIPPFALTFWRWFTACLLILPFGWSHVRREWTIVRANGLRLLLLSLLGVGTFNLLQYTAAQTTTAINMSLIHQTLPIMTLPIAWWWARERLGRAHYVGIALALGGAVMIVTQGTWRSLVQLRIVPGDLLMLIAVAMFAVYSVLFKRWALALHPLAMHTTLVAISVALLIPPYLWEYAQTGPFVPTAPALAAILYVGVGPSLLCYLIWNWALTRIGPNKTSASNYLHPMFVVTLAVALLGEKVAAYHWVGGALIIGGVVYAVHGSGRAGHGLTREV